MTVAVSEVFGPTVQGEGPSCGRRAVFVRLALCNLDCGDGEGATWACDTPYTWAWDRFDRMVEVVRLDVDAVVRNVLDRLGSSSRKLVVITGGEPMVQRNQVADLVARLWATDPFVEVEVETNGTIAPPDWLASTKVRWNVSAKLANSGVERSRRIVPDVLEVLRDAGARWKFVVTRREDVDEVDELVDEFDLDPSLVWLMPGGVEAQLLNARLAAIAPTAVERGYNLTPRLHIQAWGNRRGV